jgi:DNA-binding NarL/FixJ family response regulator
MQNSADVISVVIVEDDPVFRGSIVSLLNQCPTTICIGAYEGKESFLRIFDQTSPDIFWIDINLKDGNGIELIEFIKTQRQDTLCLICTLHEDNDTVYEALSKGADGYILKNASTDQMLEALKELKAGGAPMSPFIARKVLTSFRQVSTKAEAESLVKTLSSRERDVLENLAKGMRYKEVATLLFISHETVKKHVRNIYAKLQVQNKTEAVLSYLKDHKLKK